MPPLCRFFKTTKGCVNPKCKFFHPQPSGRGRGVKRGHPDSSGGNYHSWEGAGPSKERRVSDNDQYQVYGFDIYRDFEQLNSDYDELVNDIDELKGENARRLEEINKN